MDPTLDPFSPQSPAQGIGNTPATTANVATQWSDALNDPVVRTSLLQFGLSMMQPPAWGDTVGSQVGRAIGSSGEALTRGSEEDRRQQETESKAGLREAQAGAAEARAGAAGARAGAASERIGLQREKLAMDKDRLTLAGILGKQRRQVDAANAYTRYLSTRSPIDTTPTLSKEEFYNQSGFGDLLGGGPAGGSKDNSALVSQAEQAIAAGANPEAVRQRYRERTGEEAPF